RCGGRPRTRLLPPVPHADVGRARPAVGTALEDAAFEPQLPPAVHQPRPPAQPSARRGIHRIDAEPPNSRGEVIARELLGRAEANGYEAIDTAVARPGRAGRDAEVG